MNAPKRTKTSRAIVAKARKVLAFARKRAGEVQNRMELRNALYTPGAIVPATFPTEAERKAFSKTKEYDQLVALLVSMPPPPLSDEVIEIRIPPAENGKKKRAARPRTPSAARRT